jgi:hypothetical protein
MNFFLAFFSKYAIFVFRGLNMIQDDFEYYTAHQEEIVKDHLGEFVVIKDSAVIGYFVEEAKAFETMKGNELETFIVKKCQAVGTDVVTYYNNRVAFA